MKLATSRRSEMKIEGNDNALHKEGESNSYLFDIYLNEGRKCMKEKDYNSALQSLNKALEFRPGESSVLLVRSRCHLAMGRRLRALRDADSILDQNPSNPEALYAKAETLFQSGNYELALIYFHRGLKLEPESKHFRSGIEKAESAVLKFGGKSSRTRLRATDKVGRRKHRKVETQNRMRDNVPRIPPLTNRTGHRSWSMTPDDFRSEFLSPLTRITKKPGLSYFRSLQTQSEGCSSELSSLYEAPNTPVDERVLSQILGELNADRKYLHRLHNFPVLSKAEEADLAGDGISYLYKCGAYWDSLGPLPPPQPTRRRYRSTPNTPRDDTKTPQLPSFLEKVGEPVNTAADINFQFLSCKQDNAMSVVMKTDSHGPGRSKSLLFSEPTMTSLKERLNVTQTRSTNLSLVTEFETIGKLVSRGNWSECMSRAESCLNDVEATGDNEIPDKLSIMAKLHSYVGNAAAAMGDYNKAQYHHWKDLHIGENDDLPDAVSRALGNLGRIYTTLRKFNEALNVLARKAPLCSNPEEVAWVFLEIGTCFLALGHYDYARDCAKKVLNAARGPNFGIQRLQANLLLGSSYERLKKLVDAYKSYRTALLLAKEREDNMAELAINRAIIKVEKKMAFQERSPKKKHVEVDLSETVISEPTYGALSNRTATSSVNTNYQSLSEVTNEADNSEFEVDPATVFSVMRRLRHESGALSANPFSDYQDLEDIDFASSTDEFQEIPVSRRPSSNVYQKKSISGHKAVLRKKSISFKLCGKDNSIDEHCYDFSTCTSSMSSVSLKSRKERAALILKKRLMNIKYQKVESDWSPPHIDPTRHITNLNESRNKDPTSVEDHYKYELRKPGKRDEDEVKQTIDIRNIVASEIAAAIEDEKCNDPLEADEDESHPLELYIEGDIIEQVTSAEDFLYPHESLSFSSSFANEFSVHQEDLLMMTTEEDLQEAGLEVTEEPEEKVNEANSHELKVHRVSNTDVSKAKSENAYSLKTSKSCPSSVIVPQDVSTPESDKNNTDVEDYREKHPEKGSNASKTMSTITHEESTDYADDVLTENGSIAVDGKTKDSRNIYDVDESKKTISRSFRYNQPDFEKTVKKQVENDKNTSKVLLQQEPLLGKANGTSQKKKHSKEQQNADDSRKSFHSKEHLFKSKYHDTLFAKKSPWFQDEDKREDANGKTLTKISPRESLFKSKYHDLFAKENPNSADDDNDSRIIEQPEQQATPREPLFKSKYHELFKTKPEEKQPPIKYEPKLYQSFKKQKDQTHKTDTQSEKSELHTQVFPRGSHTHNSNYDVDNESSKNVFSSEKVDKLDLTSITADGNKSGASPKSRSNSGRKILKKESLLPAFKDSPFNKPLRSPKEKSTKRWNVLENKLKTGSKASEKRITQLPTQHQQEKESTSKKSKLDMRSEGFQKERKYVNHWLKLKGVSPRYPESDNSYAGFNDIPSYIQEKKILFRLSKKNDKIVFTPLDNSELEKNWKVIYMRIRKGDKTFTVPVATDASELENIDSSAQIKTGKQKLKKQRFGPNRKLYPVQLDQKQRFKLRMNRRNLRTVEEDKEYKISPRTPISNRSNQNTLSQNQGNLKQKHVIRRSRRFDNGHSQNERRSISLRIRNQKPNDTKSPTRDSGPASTVIKVPRGQEVVYRQEDRDGKTVLVPVVKEAGHKMVLVKVRQSDRTFILPLIVGEA